MANDIESQGQERAERETFRTYLKDTLIKVYREI